MDVKMQRTGFKLGTGSKPAPELPQLKCQVFICLSAGPVCNYNINATVQDRNTYRFVDVIKMKLEFDNGCGKE